MKYPKDLRKEGKKFYKDIFTSYEFEEHHLKILEQACRCLDRITEARERIAVDGLYVKDRYGSLKEHPGAKTERDNRVLFARLVRELGLDLADNETRPPRQY